MYEHKHVLVAVDGSADSEAVLTFLLRIAGPLDMRVTLLRVLEPVVPDVIEGSRHVVVEDAEARRTDAEEYLAALAADLRSRGVETRCRVGRGKPAEEILAAARAEGVDFIAMATHGRSGVRRLLFGSVAETVLRHADVPVFLIRQPAMVGTTEGR
jgi:nucleotide-binding universal stress UspA family protein